MDVLQGCVKLGNEAHQIAAEQVKGGRVRDGRMDTGRLISGLELGRNSCTAREHRKGRKERE